MARAFPPPAPSKSAVEVVAWYLDHTSEKRAGFFVMMIGGAIVTPFIAMIVAQVRRMQGVGRAAADIQLLLGAMLVAGLALLPMFGEAAAFRPASSPATTQGINDIFWLLFVGWVAPFIAEEVFIALAILTDRRDEPVFPRWIGYGVLAASLMSFFGGLCVFVKTGPLAWNGFLAFWLAVASFGWWLMIMTVGMLYAIGRDAVDHHAKDEHERGRIPLPVD